MHTHQDPTELTHSHRFASGAEHQNERRALLVVGLTGVMMIAEIIGGLVTGSMALLADGWHMGSHFAVLGLAAFAYRFARVHAHDRRYTFGTGKVGPLAGFSSAVVLALIALGMIYESAHRLINPVAIAYSTAIIVAALALTVNLASAALLGGHRQSDEPHEHHEHDQDQEHHHDHNLRAAYAHVLADALTSLLAIFALAGGALLGLRWLDPLIGIVGAGVILWWSWGLIHRSSKVLLDVEANAGTTDAIRSAIEADGDSRVVDLHLWQVGTGHLALIVSVMTHQPRAPEYYKRLLRNISSLSHITVEVVPCSTVQRMVA